MRRCILAVMLPALIAGLSVLPVPAPAHSQESAAPDSAVSETRGYGTGATADSIAAEIPPEEAPSDSITAPVPAPSFRLEDIIVTGARLTGGVEKVPAAVFVIDRSEIEGRFDKTVVNILEEKEGVNSGSYGSFGALELISLRGSRFGSVPTLLDGVRINNEQNGAVDFYSIPSSMLERIEVLRGPLGLLHGGNGVVGVVNFITAEPVRGEKPIARIGLASGSFGYSKHAADFARYYGTLGTFFGIEGVSSEGVGAYRNYSGRSYFGKLNYDVGEKKEMALLISSYSGDLKTVREAKQKSDATRLQLVGSIPVSEEGKLELRAFHSTEKTDYKDPYTATLSDLERYGALVDFYKYGTRTGNVAAGGGFTRSVLDCEDVSPWNPKTWEGYAFAADELVLATGLKGLVSIRADRHSTFGTEVSPCVCLWREMEHGKVWLSSGRGFNPPTLNDLFWPTQASSWEGWTYVTKGNEKLKAESSWMTELGSSYSLLENSVRVDVSCYVSRTSDFIQWGSTVSAPDLTVTYTPLNTEQVDARGVEGGLEFAFRGERVGGVNLTLQNVENGENESLPYMPQTRVNSWFSKSFEPLPDLVVNVSMDATYEGKHLEPLGSSQGRFLVVEGKLSVSLAGFTAFARLRNATNEYYPSRYLEFAPGQKGPDAVYYPMPSRNYDVGITFQLLD